MLCSEWYATVIYPCIKIEGKEEIELAMRMNFAVTWYVKIGENAGKKGPTMMEKKCTKWRNCGCGIIFFAICIDEFPRPFGEFDPH